MDSPSPERIHVEVAYARPDVQVLLPVELEAGATVEEAVRRSGVLERFPEIDLGGRNKVGIWGRVTRLNQPLRDGDRVEIYRPLIADPKEVRRQRAAARGGRPTG